MFHPTSELVFAGLKVMGYGLIGVFTVLILFYLATKLMVFVFSKLSFKNRGKES
jgi:hypothetical protein